ncbi:endothelin-converting enzyme homolog [Gordionus sp. m RMFG-2023]|uniref:endothelin-converting enzyme homolog n=1 Tax=Gordionus sp. m RMFG-2023 TaxID=3053472 RepID=UPI0031FBC5CD
MTILLPFPTPNSIYALLTIKDNKTNSLTILNEFINLKSFDMIQLTSWMNQSMDPCTDFYEFACGGYIQKTSIPSGYNRWDQISAISESILLTIKDILGDYSSSKGNNKWLGREIIMSELSCVRISNNKNPHTKYEARAERLAKTYYDSCMDKNIIREKLGGKPLTDLLDLYGGWDVLNVDNKPSPFIDESSNLKKDPKNSSKYILCIYPGQVAPPYDDDYEGNATFINLKRYDAYLKYMLNVGNLVVTSSGFPKERRLNQHDSNLTRYTLGREEHRQTPINNQLKTVMSNVLKFEGHLSNITPSSMDLETIDESNYVLMSLKELDNNFDFMNWTKYINQYFEVHNISMPTNQVFWVTSISYMEKMNSLIKRSLNEMGISRVLHDYIMWHNVKPLTPYLSKKFGDAVNPVLKAHNIKNYEKIPAWKKCLENFPTFMKFPLSSLYLKSNFDSSDKIKVEGIVDSLKMSYKDAFRNLDWMDETTKSRSMEKVDAINVKIGYPEYIVDSKELDKDYEGVEHKINIMA